MYDSPTGGLDPITSTTIIELVVKQRDVSHTTSLLITHRLQDAFTLATNTFDQESGKMKLNPDGGIEESTQFLVLNEGSIVYNGDTTRTGPLGRSVDQAVPVLTDLSLTLALFPFNVRNPRQGQEGIARFNVAAQSVHAANRVQLFRLDVRPGRIHKLVFNKDRHPRDPG